jgi:hypothetical protein
MGALSRTPVRPKSGKLTLGGAASFGSAPMAERVFTAVLLGLFACFLYFAGSDIVRLLEQGAFGGVFLLLDCVILCIGWIAFLGALVLARTRADAESFQTHEWQPVSE